MHWLTSKWRTIFQANFLLGWLLISVGELLGWYDLVPDWIAIAVMIGFLVAFVALCVNFERQYRAFRKELARGKPWVK